MAKPSVTTARSRRLRNDMTVAERRVWSILCRRRIHGLKFRRQEPIGRYIVDVVCYAQRLIVEVDGDQHAGAAADRAGRVVRKPRLPRAPHLEHRRVRERGRCLPHHP
jgi:very-short-patch-repair endonuclease